MKHLSSLATLAREWAAFSLPPVLSDAEVLEAQRLLGEMRRITDARAAQLAAQIAHRSRPELGSDGLAQRLGARTPQQLVQKITGVGRKEAAVMVRVGALAESRQSTGWVAMLSAALHDGRVSVAAAEVIRRALEGLELPPEQLAAALSELLGIATTVGMDRLAAHARQTRDRLDPAGIPHREDALRERRSLTLFPLPDGMTRLIGLLDPESAAEIRAVYDAATSPRRGGPRFVNPEQEARTERVLADPRTTEQIALDAFVTVLRAGATASVAEVLGVQRPAVRIHVTAHDLRTGIGGAQFEGHTTTLGLATVHRLACASGTIPIHFDTDGHVLNVGRAHRYFTPRQRIALAARDGGCRFPGCDRPPTWTEAHHIHHWDRDHGKTNINDGILLCRHHHLLTHNNGWDIRRHGADYWVVPPPDVDPQQRPIAAPAQMFRQRSTAS